jgi:hypothetical protein
MAGRIKQNIQEICYCIVQGADKKFGWTEEKGE